MTRIADYADEGQSPLWAWWQSLLRGAQLPSPAACTPLRVVDLFCGAGGLGLGTAIAARAHGRELMVLRAVDTDAAALGVYQKNLRPQIAINRSVAAMVDYQLRTRGGTARLAYPPKLVDRGLRGAENADLLIAGPPCQGHSNLNNHSRRSDPRNHLFVTTVAVGIALSVRAMVIENVPTVRNAREKVVDVSRQVLQDFGYHVSEMVLSADQLGWPQSRSRLFLVAVREGEAISTVDDAAFASFASDWMIRSEAPRPVMWAIKDLAAVGSFGVFDTAPQPSEENRRRIDYLFDNGLFDLPDAERPKCHRNGTSYTSVYGRMRPDRPAQTITTGIGTPGQGRFIHPALRRLITPHEAARIQGFPDWYSFHVDGGPTSRGQLAKWIGDAVPPFLGFIGLCFALRSLLDDQQPSPTQLDLRSHHVAAE